MLLLLNTLRLSLPHILAPEQISSPLLFQACPVGILAQSNGPTQLWLNITLGRNSSTSYEPPICERPLSSLTTYCTVHLMVPYELLVQSHPEKFTLGQCWCPRARRPKACDIEDKLVALKIDDFHNDTILIISTGACWNHQRQPSPLTSGCEVMGSWAGGSARVAGRVLPTTW